MNNKILNNRSKLDEFIRNTVGYVGKIKYNLNSASFASITRGIPIHLVDRNVVLKLDPTKSEFRIAKKLKGTNTKTFVRVYATYYFSELSCNGYIRDYCDEIKEGTKYMNFLDSLGEELYELEDYLYDDPPGTHARDSNTNLSYAFDDEFLDFLTDFHQDVHRLNILDSIDYSGLPTNIGLLEGKLKIFDF